MATTPALVADRLCPDCDVPLAEHARCWRPSCPTLFGRQHPETAPNPARLGLCARCWRSFVAWVNGQSAIEPSRPRRSAWLTPREAADLTGRSLDTVHRWIRTGVLPAQEWPGRTSSDPRGRRLRIRRADVDQLLVGMQDSA